MSDDKNSDMRTFQASVPDDVTGAVYLIRLDADGEMIVAKRFQEDCREEEERVLLELEIMSSN